MTAVAPIDESCGIFQLALSAIGGTCETTSVGAGFAGSGAGFGAASATFTSGIAPPNVTCRRSPSLAMLYVVASERSTTTRVTSGLNCAVRIFLTMELSTSIDFFANLSFTPARSLTTCAGLASLNAL